MTDADIDAEDGLGTLLDAANASPDLERPNTDQHPSFGYGIHFCMGNRLAELQLRVLWEEILPRFERIEVQAEPERVFSTFVRGDSKLPVTVTRR